jgi:hypothetical protein
MTKLLLIVVLPVTFKLLYILTGPFMDVFPDTFKELLSDKELFIIVFPDTFKYELIVVDPISNDDDETQKLEFTDNDPIKYELLDVSVTILDKPTIFL